MAESVNGKPVPTMRGPMAVLLTIIAAAGVMALLIVLVYVFGALLATELDVAFLIAYLAMLPVIVWLIWLAYPPEKRTWWRWLLFIGLWFLTGIAAAILLPWMAITRRNWTNAAVEVAPTPP